MQPTKANLMRLAKRLGATVDIAYEAITVQAPKGHHFALHGFHESCGGCSGATATERYGDAIADLTDEANRPVFARCTPEECDGWDEKRGCCPWWGPDETSPNE